jgi:phosphonatase-like hydrolase
VFSVSSVPSPNFPRIELVVFDMAGTTIDAGGGVADIFKSTLARWSVPVTDAQVAAVRGASKRQAIADLLRRHAPERAGDLDAIDSTFRAALSDAAGRFTLCPGADDAVRRCRERGVRVALNTGFDRAVTTVVLEAVGWTTTADAVICGDDVPRGRPAPYLIFLAMERTGVTSVHAVAIVGDTALDLQAGFNAGVKLNIGVCSGAHSREMLLEHPHTHLLDSVAEVPQLLV